MSGKGAVSIDALKPGEITHNVKLHISLVNYLSERKGRVQCVILAQHYGMTMPK